MCDEVAYICSSGEVLAFDLARAILLGDGDPLRSWRWAYSLGSRSLDGAQRVAREATLEVLADVDAADRMRRLFCLDMAVGSPGTLSVNGWSQRAFVTAATVDVWRGRAVCLTLTVALLDGAWRKPVTRLFRPLEADPAEEWLDLPCDLPCDLLPTVGDSAIESESPTASPIVLTIWGPAASPELTIGGNVYAFDIDIPGGSRLVVDGASWPRSITMVSEYGDEADCFSCGERGEGVGSGRYCFEPVPAGRSAVSWEGGFGFDVTYYVEEDAPPWS